MKTKICTICHRELPLDAFGKCSRNKNGLKELCKECNRNKGKIYRQNNKEKIQKKHAEYRQQNRDAILLKSKEYHATHREQEKAYRLKYKQEVARPYCVKGQETQIENYAMARSENFKDWSRHHRFETHNSDGEKRLVNITVEELKALDMYYNRPAEELIWLRNKEHSKLHSGESR
jgi:hypothetical protein